MKLWPPKQFSIYSSMQSSSTRSKEHAKVGENVEDTPFITIVCTTLPSLHLLQMEYFISEKIPFLRRVNYLSRSVQDYCALSMRELGYIRQHSYGSYQRM